MRTMKYKLSKHASSEMKRRGIPLSLLEPVLENPQQVVPGRGAKKVYQSQVDFGSGKVFLLRAVVNDTADPMEVITVYRTSKISKYWRLT